MKAKKMWKGDGQRGWPLEKKPISLEALPLVSDFATTHPTHAVVDASNAHNAPCGCTMNEQAIPKTVG